MHSALGILSTPLNNTQQKETRQDAVINAGQSEYYWPKHEHYEIGVAVLDSASSCTHASKIADD